MGYAGAPPQQQQLQQRQSTSWHADAARDGGKPPRGGPGAAKCPQSAEQLRSARRQVAQALGATGRKLWRRGDLTAEDARVCDLVAEALARLSRLLKGPAGAEARTALASKPPAASKVAETSLRRDAPAFVPALSLVERLQLEPADSSCPSQAAAVGCPSQAADHVQRAEQLLVALGEAARSQARSSGSSSDGSKRRNGQHQQHKEQQQEQEQEQK